MEDIVQTKSIEHSTVQAIASREFVIDVGIQLTLIDECVRLLMAKERNELQF